MTVRRAKVAEIRLGDVLVGYLSRYADGKCLLVFDDGYVDLGPSRPTLSLSFLVPGDEDRTVTEKLQRVWRSSIRLPPFFSNLLPEGSLRTLVCDRLGIDEDDEFELLCALGHDLPGAVTATPTDEAPDSVLAARPGVVTEVDGPADEEPFRFSLAGVQLKMSMVEAGGRFTLPGRGELGRFVVKPPSIVHRSLPENEFVAMELARAAGSDVPETRLVPLADVDGLKKLNLPDEPFAYAVRRFDRRDAGQRTHVEDFAQVLGLKPHEKYRRTNYDTLARLVSGVFADGAKNVEELVRRLVVHLLVGNGDAHVKNWSVIYPDGRRPTLAPVYDVVSTLPYAEDRTLALNLARKKGFYEIDAGVWERFAERCGLPPRFVVGVVEEAVGRARAEWPRRIAELPAPEAMREALARHWAELPAPCDGVR